MEVTRTKPAHCKGCLKVIDAHTAIDGDRSPIPSDLSICLYCGKICMFDPSLNLSPMTPSELEQMKVEDFENWRTLQRASAVITAEIKKN